MLLLSFNLMQSLFKTDLEALIYILLISVGLYVLNRLISLLIYRLKKLTISQQNKIKFVFKIISVITVLFLLIRGFPSFSSLPSSLIAIITSMSSTALAFATSEIFSNSVAGILLWVIDPFDIGDVIKVKGEKGIVKSFSLTKTVIETFDKVPIEISNSDILSSIVLNYSIKVSTKKNFRRFKREIRVPQDIGNARLDIDEYNEEIRKEENEELRNLFNQMREKDVNDLHVYNFKMRIPFEKFRIKVDMMENVCKRFKDIFGFKPRFHIMDFSNEIVVKFRVLTLDAENLSNQIYKFIEKVYQVIHGS